MIVSNNGDGYRKSNQTFLRDYNTKKILNILRLEGPLSRVDIAKVSNLDKKTITNIVNSLLKEDQVEVYATKNEGSGRPKELLTLNGRFCRCIGIDIGATYIAGVILDFKGEVLCDAWLDIDSNVDSEVLVSYCEYIINQLLKKIDIAIEKIDKIGISFPGYFDNESGISILAENLPSWRNITIKKLFEKKYDKEVFINDCSRLSALAELWYGGGKGQGDFLVFDIGYGIGCGIVINNEVFLGGNGKSGEVGHTIVKVNGPECTCGRHGCIESLSSEWAILKQGRELILKRPDGILGQTVRNRHKTVTIKDIVLSAELGDEHCENILVEAGKYIGVGIANGISWFNPKKIILGGTMLENNAVLVDSIIKSVQANAIPELYEDVVIIKSSLGIYASSIGAATMCIAEYY